MEKEKNSFGIERIVKLFLEKWYIFVAFLGVCLVACSIYYFMVLDEYYVAATTIYVTEAVTDEKNENTELMVNEKRAKDYKVIATSNRVLDKVKVKFPNVTIRPADISVNEYPDTRIFKLSVKHINPYVAAEVANEITKIMIEEVEDIISKNNIKVIDFAKTPTTPQKGRVYVYYILAVVAAAFLSLLVVLVFEIFDNKVKGPEDFSERFDLPIVGMIPKHEIYDDFEKRIY